MSEGGVGVAGGPAAHDVVACGEGVAVFGGEDGSESEGFEGAGAVDGAPLVCEEVGEA